MKICYELDLNTFEAWSGAVDTIDRIRNEDKVQELEEILDELYPDGMTETELNDLLWFDSDTVYEWLGMRTYEEVQEEIDEVQAEMQELRQNYADDCEELHEKFHDLSFGELEAKKGELWAEYYADDMIELQEKLDELEEELNVL